MKISKIGIIMLIVAVIYTFAPDLLPGSPIDDIVIDAVCLFVAWITSRKKEVK